jgi:hypothetical protein
VFAENDALLCQRSGVRDGYDRCANLEINYLLQRAEERNRMPATVTYGRIGR